MLRPAGSLMQIIRLLHFKQSIYAIRKDHRFCSRIRGQIAVFACKTLTIHLNKPACCLPPDKSLRLPHFQLCSKSSGVNPFTDARFAASSHENYAGCVGILRGRPAMYIPLSAYAEKRLPSSSKPLPP